MKERDFLPRILQAMVIVENKLNEDERTLQKLYGEIIMSKKIIEQYKILIENALMPCQQQQNKNQILDINVLLEKKLKQQKKQKNYLRKVVEAKIRESDLKDLKIQQSRSIFH